jgi:AAA family ATP:ADP antiporter
MNKLHQSYPNPLQFSLYISRVTSITGVFSVLLALFVCRQAIQQFGWTATALITPFIWLITGLAFLFGILMEDNFLYQNFVAFLDLTPIAFTVLVGATQLSLGRASKYTLFDQTKEMAFIPLDPSEQRTGKVWIEGIVTWVGKLGAALIYQLFLVLCLEACLVSYVLFIFIALLLIWIICVRQLGRNIKVGDRSTSLTEKNRTTAVRPAEIGGV